MWFYGYETQSDYSTSSFNGEPIRFYGISPWYSSHTLRLTRTPRGPPSYARHKSCHILDNMARFKACHERPRKYFLSRPRQYHARTWKIWQLDRLFALPYFLILNEDLIGSVENFRYFSELFFEKREIATLTRSFDGRIAFLLAWFLPQTFGSSLSLLRNGFADVRSRWKIITLYTVILLEEK